MESCLFRLFVACCELVARWTRLNAAIVVRSTGSRPPPGRVSRDPGAPPPEEEPEAPEAKPGLEKNSGRAPRIPNGRLVPPARGL